MLVVFQRMRLVTPLAGSVRLFAGLLRRVDCRRRRYRRKQKARRAFAIGDSGPASPMSAS